MTPFEQYQAKRAELQRHRASCRHCSPGYRWPAGCATGERLYQETRRLLSQANRPPTSGEG